MASEPCGSGLDAGIVFGNTFTGERCHYDAWQPNKQSGQKFGKSCTGFQIGDREFRKFIRL
jgi:hypothetical protein